MKSVVLEKNSCLTDCTCKLRDKLYLCILSVDIGYCRRGIVLVRLNRLPAAFCMFTDASENQL